MRKLLLSLLMSSLGSSISFADQVCKRHDPTLVKDKSDVILRSLPWMEGNIYYGNVPVQVQNNDVGPCKPRAIKVGFPQVEYYTKVAKIPHGHILTTEMHIVPFKGDLPDYSSMILFVRKNGVFVPVDSMGLDFTIKETGWLGY